MPRAPHDHPLPPIAWIAACNPMPGTFAEEALSGMHYTITCRGCRRHVARSARQFCAAGWGNVQVVGLHRRFVCLVCGHRGADITVSTNWPGPHPAADWAETVEARMLRNGS